MKKVTGILLGAIVICIGVAYFLSVFEVFDFKLSLDGWWTLFIILPSLCSLLTGRDIVGSLIGIVAGVALLLAAQGVYEYAVAWKIILPVVVVAIGAEIIVKAVRGKKKEQVKIEIDVDEDDVDSDDRAAIFNEKNRDYDGEEFSAAKVMAIFGSSKCNLKNAKFSSKNELDVFCVFGGAEIIVPENVTIRNNAFCLFGGLSDKREVKGSDEDCVTLTINGVCVFGGVDVKSN